LALSSLLNLFNSLCPLFFILATTGWYVANAQTVPPANSIMVRAKSKPNQAWKEYPTRTIDTLPGFAVGAKQARLSSYGGWLDKKMTTTGFFHTQQVGGRWWLVDPAGYAFIHVGVVSVTPGTSAISQAALKEKFGTEEKWAAATTQMLKENSFNGAGAWSATDLLRQTPTRTAYTMIWNFMSSYGKKRGGTYQQPGHTGYPNDCIFVFDPDFVTFCDEHARQLAATKDDPYLLGHFSDNELPFPGDALDRYLSLPQTDPGYGAAQSWLRERKHNDQAGKTDITDDDRAAFRGYLVDRYLSITTAAIRKYDPHHLCLGPRFHSSELHSKPAFQAAGKYLDAIAINYYGAWTPNPVTMANWESWSGKSFIITEWYVKGDDTGMGNTGGAGWIVPTQKDRGLFYQNFTLGLLESKACVGWHWFKYMDNDPTNLKADPSNRDSNKGIVNIRYEPYLPLIEKMKQLNDNVYPLTEYFDKSGG